MFVESRISRWLNLYNCRQSIVLQIVLEIRIRNADGANILGILRRNRLSPLEILDVAGLQQTGWIVGRSRAARVCGIHVNLPADVLGLEFLKDGRCRQQIFIPAIGAYWIDISLRSTGYQIFAIGMSPKH